MSRKNKKSNKPARTPRTSPLPAYPLLAPGAKPPMASKTVAKAVADVRAADRARNTQGTPPVKAKSAAATGGSRKPSLLTLAAAVLVKARTHMSVKEIVAKVLTSGQWKTKGKTPAATLYAAIIREIADKGKASRFEKTARGLFRAARPKIAH